MCVSRLETYFPFLYKYLAHLINLFYFAQLNSLECRHRLTKRLYHRGSRTCGWPIDRSPKKGPWPRAEVTPHPLHRSAFATTWAGPRAGCWPEQELKTFQIFIGSKRPENWTFVLAGNVRYFGGKITFSLNENDLRLSLLLLIRKHEFFFSESNYVYFLSWLRN